MKLIMGSVSSTVPTALRGSCPLKIRVGVSIGPQPPPPQTSTKAAANPSMDSKRGGIFLMMASFFSAKRSRISSPMMSSIELTTGLAKDRDIKVRA